MTEKKYDYHRDNPSFLVYKDVEEDILDLPDAKAGQVFKATFAFATRGEIVELEGAEKVVLRNICRSIERDGRKYEQKCRKNAKNAQKAHQANAGGRQRSDADIDIGIGKDKGAEIDIVSVMETINDTLDNEINETTVRSVGLPLKQELLTKIIDEFGYDQVKKMLIKMAFWQITAKRIYTNPSSTLLSFLKADIQNNAAKQTSYDLDQWEEFAMNFDPTQALNKHQDDMANEESPDGSE